MPSVSNETIIETRVFPAQICTACVYGMVGIVGLIATAISLVKVWGWFPELPQRSHTQDIHGYAAAIGGIVVFFMMLRITRIWGSTAKVIGDLITSVDFLATRTQLRHFEVIGLSPTLCVRRLKGLTLGVFPVRGTPGVMRVIGPNHDVYVNVRGSEDVEWLKRWIGPRSEDSSNDGLMDE